METSSQFSKSVVPLRLSGSGPAVAVEAVIPASVPSSSVSSSPDPVPLSLPSLSRRSFSFHSFVNITIPGLAHSASLFLMCPADGPRVVPQFDNLYIKDVKQDQINQSIRRWGRGVKY
jgi:hypothetical protein